MRAASFPLIFDSPFKFFVMKRTLLAGLILVFCAIAGVRENVSAQITSISLDSVQIYTQTNCLLPSTVNVILMGGVGGTIPTNDSLTVYLNFGDGSDTTFKHPYSTSNWYYGSLNHVYTIAGNFQVMGIVTTSNNLTDTFYSNFVALSNSCAPLSGRVFIDANNDCVYQTGETVVPFAVLKIENTATNAVYYTYADVNGQYLYGVPAGTYTIEPKISNPGMVPTCPGSGSVTQVVTTPGTFVNDFAYSCNTSTPPDAYVGASVSNWRIGFDRMMFIHLASTSVCVNAPGTLTATLPTGLSYTGTVLGAPAPAVSGNTLTWNVSSLTAITSWYTWITIHTATSVNLGDTLCVPIVFTPTAPDVNAANNSVTVCAEANNSYDPNDKRVSPEGTGTAGNIPNGTDLTYMIRFQNTGNDVAYTVTVKDKIDSDLDLSTLRVQKTSHPMNFSFVGDEAVFRFENINLPDSASNEPASHGFIIYTVSPKANLPLGTTITNTADIYFDFNEAIITNTTLNTIAQPQSVRRLSNGTLTATVYPNPADGILKFDVEGNKPYKVEMFDMLGRSVRTLQSAKGNTSIDVKQLPAGMYVLKITDDANNVLSTKINIRH